jgi:serine/threonine protein kinase
VSSEQWQQIEALFHAALEREPGEREAFLAQACADDQLLREVEALLAQEPCRTNLLDRPAWAVAEGLTAWASTQTELPPGMQIGPYRIEGRLGAGGMGTVFRAVDTRLGRLVAIKTSHNRYSERFERESRVIAALNHPNICTLYDVGPNYLVMELCEGETLEARIRKGALPLEEASKLGSQIAAGLAAAHAKGIIHRDLKPANVIVTKAGVKLLDFGLAKSAADETLTAACAVMGTPAYMAPEQREGRPCDARTDIYALGLILRAMTTGKPDPASMTDTTPVLAQRVEPQSSSPCCCSAQTNSPEAQVGG